MPDLFRRNILKGLLASPLLMVRGPSDEEREERQDDSPIIMPFSGRGEVEAVEKIPDDVDPGAWIGSPYHIIDAKFTPGSAMVETVMGTPFSTGALDECEVTLRAVGPEAGQLWDRAEALLHATGQVPIEGLREAASRVRYRDRRRSLP